MLQSARKMNEEVLSFLCNKDNDICKSRGRSRRSNSAGEPSNSHHEEKLQSERIATRGLNNSCSSSDATGDGVGKNEKRICSVGYSIEIEQNNTSMLHADAISLLLMPHHPGVQLKFFHLCDKTFLKQIVSIFFIPVLLL